MLLNEFLEQSAESSPDKIALRCGTIALSYSQIEQSSNVLCAGLIGLGFAKQDRVVIYLENSPESVIALFAILKAGGIFVIVNPKTKAPKMAYILADCQAKVLITDQKHLAEATKEVKSPPPVIIVDCPTPPVGENDRSSRPVFSLSEILQSGLKRPAVPRCIDIDLASLIYTSGSSGSPKGVMLTHLNMVSAANSITQYLHNRRDDIIMDALPLAFDYGLYQVLMAFKMGATVILEKGFTFPETVISKVIANKVTGWPLLPTMVAMLLKFRNLGDRDFSNLRYITSTGQALPPAHILRLQRIFPRAELFSMYGLTECKRVAYLPPSELLKKPDSVGKAMPNTDAYIVDESGNEIKESDVAGELVVRGSNVMKGYWGLPKETSRALRPGRLAGELVLYTGDLFKQDCDGDLYFLGRKDDIIKTSGHMVSPREVENAICELEGVIEAAVIGVPDEIKGKVIKAFVRLSSGSAIGVEDVAAHCRSRLEDFAAPEIIVITTEPLPKTDSGKIQKMRLNQRGPRETL